MKYAGVVAQPHCLASLAVFAALVGAAGCFPADSEDLKTSGLFAQYWVRTSGNQTRIDATIKVGSGVSNQVRLTAGDHLVAYVANLEIPLVEEQCSGKCIPGIFYSYVGTSDVIAADTNVRIALLRPPKFESAPNSSILLPSPHLITEPAANAYSHTNPLSRSRDKIYVRWAPVSSADKVSTRINADCMGGDIATKQGNGLDSILLDVSQVKSPASDGSCGISVWVTIERTGTVDHAFGKGGTFTAVREQSIYMPSLP